MQLEGGLFVDIVIIFAAAFLGGVAARILRLPVLLGYLVLGMVIGPQVLGIISNIEDVQTLAEFGVILLLFAVGIEVSFRELRSLGRAVVLIGIGQVLVTIGLAFPIGFLLGWLPEQAIVFGLVISLSSTMVVLKTLSDRGELRSLHGRMLTGILLIQDIAFIPMIAILPALGGDSGEFLTDLGLGIGKAAAVLVAIALLGGKAIPTLLSRVARLGSREVFVLTLIAITFVTAALTQSVGLSAAIGAFVAGLLLSESEFGYRALSEVIPIRDTFSALFFISLGMLTDPAFLVENAWTALIVVSVVILIKLAVTSTLARAFGYLPATALLTGIGMVQIGEFSFILADSAAESGAVGQDFLSLIVGCAVLTMAITPGIIASGSRAIIALGKRIPLLEPGGAGDEARGGLQPPLNGHTIICGSGRVGSLVAQALHEHKLPFVIIELDPQVAARYRSLGHYVILGSSASETILEAANVRSARLMVISTGDPVSTWVTAQEALNMNPALDIVARVYWREEGERLQKLGVREVVWPAMEAGLEMLRHSLKRYQTDPVYVDALISRLRSSLSFGTGREAEERPSPGGDGVIPTRQETDHSDD